METPFTYTVTTGENQSEMQYFGLLSFQTFLGFNTCDFGLLPPGDTPIPIPLSLATKSPTTPLSSPDPSTNTTITSVTTNVTSSATTARTRNRSQKAAIGTAIPVGGTALLVLVLFLFWQRIKRQRTRRMLDQTVQEERSESNPPFLQTKPELQGEDSKHELSAEDRRFELDQNARYEIMTEEHSGRPNFQAQRQELRGEEFAHELDDRDTRA